jgi:abhydrolase domain-containing protein 6
MNPNVRNLFDLHRLHTYDRSHPLVLVNGLAEQSVCWFANRRAWSRHFDLKIPELLVYDGAPLHRHVDAGGEVTIEWLTDRLHAYLDEFVQRPPYNFVGSSLGGQIIATFANRYPKLVAKLVFICPSGFYGDENLPMMEGVRRSDYDSLVKSVFHRGQFATDDLVNVIAKKFQNREWKKGVLRTLRGTVGHSVADLLETIPHPSLAIWGDDDRVISDVPGSVRAADRLLKVRQVVIPKCGHAPQIEKAHLVNQLVARFLKGSLKTIPPQLDPARYLAKLEKKERALATSAARP